MKPFEEWTLKEKMHGVIGRMPWPMPIEIAEAGPIMEEALNRIEKLEAALREIAELSIEHGVAVYIARAALAPEPLPKTILDEPTSPPEQE